MAGLSECRQAGVGRREEGASRRKARARTTKVSVGTVARTRPGHTLGATQESAPSERLRVLRMVVPGSFMWLCG